MKYKVILLFLIILIYGCESQLEKDYENIEFSCVDGSTPYLLEGEFDGKYFCYNSLSGHKFRYTISATTITKGNTTLSNIDSLNGEVIYFNNWSVRKDFRYDSIYDHNIYISSPSFTNVDSLKSFIPSILEERDLDIHSSDLSESFVITFMYNSNGDSSYKQISSFFGNQSNNNYLRITNFNEEKLLNGKTKYEFDFEFSCKLYDSIKKHDYFGEITNGVMKVNFIL